MLSLLENYEVYKNVHNFVANSMDELTLRLGDIVITSPNIVDEWGVGFSAKVYGWFPLVTCVKVDENAVSATSNGNLSNNQPNAISDEEFDKHYSFLAESIFNEEKKYISEFLLDYKNILKGVQALSQTHNKPLLKLMDICKKFLLIYRKLITDLEEQLNKPTTEQLFGTAYINHFKEIKNLLILYCEIHPFQIDEILKIKSQLDNEFQKNNINVNIIKFFSKPFTRTTQFTLLLHECCYHTDSRYVDKEKFKIACELFQLLSFCCDDIRNKSVEILELKNSKMQGLPSGEELGRVNCFTQCFICEPNNRYERYIVLTNEYLLMVINIANDDSPFKLDKYYKISNLKIKSIADNDVNFNCVQITVSNGGDSNSADNLIIVAMFGQPTIKTNFLTVWNVVQEGNNYVPFWRKTLESEKEETKRPPSAEHAKTNSVAATGDSRASVSNNEIVNYLKMINLKLNNMEKKYDNILREVQNLRIEISDFKNRQ